MKNEQGSGNIISGKYFEQDDFSVREKEVLGEVVKATGFKPEQEIFRGIVYDKEKVGSLIYRGEWENKPAVLKLQGLQPEINEAEMVDSFTSQNQSQKIRVPKIYKNQSWSEDKGYGFLISEFIDAQPLFTMPLASEKEMAEFVVFYQEYKTKAMTQPWLEMPKVDAKQFILARVAKWKQICQSKGRLDKLEYQPYFEKFIKILQTLDLEIPLEFCHAHLTANDVLKEGDDQYVLLSNLFYAYRSQWHDLGFNIWACNMHIRDTNFSFQDMEKMIDQWLEQYKQIPIVQQDPDFDKKINFVFLERTMGAILADIGVSDTFEGEENKKHLDHLLKLHQQLFERLVGKV